MSSNLTDRQQRERASGETFMPNAHHSLVPTGLASHTQRRKRLCPSPGVPTSSFQTDIFSFLTRSVRGKDVLDVGCVNHEAVSCRDPRWLHKHIVESARSAVGLDLLDTEAAKLRQRGCS